MFDTPDKYENETTQPRGLGSRGGQHSCEPSELPATCSLDHKASQCARAQWQWPPRWPRACTPWTSEGARRKERLGHNEKGHCKQLRLRLAKASAMNEATSLNEPVFTENRDLFSVAYKNVGFA